MILIVSVALVVTGVYKKKPGDRVIICMGDSLTESEFGYYPQHLSGLLKRKGIPARVISAARPGNTSGEYLDFLRRSDLLSRILPDVVVVMLGTNDVRIDRDSTPLAQFRHNLKSIISLIKNRYYPKGKIPLIFLATIPPIFKVDLKTFDESSRLRVDDEIVPAIKKLAREEGIRILDVHDFFRKRPGLLPGIHPRKKGYYALAVYVFESILPFLERK
jgi:lysophospholipase L1-like esterase